MAYFRAKSQTLIGADRISPRTALKRKCDDKLINKFKLIILQNS
jgi:hypothetical protein